MQTNHRVALSELCKAQGKPGASYQDFSRGPSHLPIFWSQVSVLGTTYTGAEAKSKKQAQEEAARVALEAIGPQEKKQAAQADLSENYKGKIQEYLAKRGQMPPNYVTQALTGYNTLQFTASCRFDDKDFVSSIQPTKQKAQHDVARLMWEHLGSPTETKPVIQTSPKGEFIALIQKLQKLRPEIYIKNEIASYLPCYEVVEYNVSVFGNEPQWIIGLYVPLLPAGEKFISEPKKKKKDAESDCAQKAINHLTAYLSQNPTSPGLFQSKKPSITSEPSPKRQKPELKPEPKPAETPITRPAASQFFFEEVSIQPPQPTLPANAAQAKNQAKKPEPPSNQKGSTNAFAFDVDLNVPIPVDPIPETPTARIIKGNGWTFTEAEYPEDPSNVFDFGS